MIAEIRAFIENERRLCLHRQIGALTTKLNVMAARHDPREGNKFYKLLAKKKRLERELRQHVFIYPSVGTEESSET